jgi:2-oxoglutarate dehydrogenase E2 component (dihydrolipoamide succinyltransferase)
MPTEVLMPQMGESIFEGTITKWLKKPGEKVERDEPLFEISTDKVDAEIPAPSAGTLKEIKVKEGETVEINTVVALLDDGAGSRSKKARRSKSTPWLRCSTTVPARPRPRKRRQPKRSPLRRPRKRGKRSSRSR